MTAHERDWDAFITLTPEGRAHMDLAVEGVTCAACMVEIERGLGAQEGVETARLNLTSHRLAVDWAPERTTAERIVETIRRLGETRRILAASPRYFAQHGFPKTLEELQQHKLAGSPAYAPLSVGVPTHDIDVVTTQVTLDAAARLLIG